MGGGSREHRWMLSAVAVPLEQPKMSPLAALDLHTGEYRSVDPLLDLRIQRRISVIWALLFFNGLPWMGIGTVVPIPQRMGQLLTMGALGAAGVLALSLNNHLLIRPNVVLGLFTLLAAVALLTSVRGTAGLGAVFRCFRLTAFLAVLWLLTPWWGRRDLLLARCHLRALLAVSATVIAGLLVAPSTALAINGRLAGVIWPIWPTAVAHFAAVAAGMGILLWLSGSMAGSRALVLGLGGIALVLLSQTRTALLGFVLGTACAAASLFPARQRVRRAMTLVLIVAPVAIVALTPALSAWFTRGQSAEELRGLTGRRQVWDMLLEAPRSEFNQWFGFGFSNRSFAGLAIDNSWLAIYQDQGLIGVAIVAAIVLYLLITPAFRPTGRARALAIFLVVFSAVDSYTEVGLGDASAYLLELTVAASLLVPRAQVGEPVPDDALP